MYSTSKKIFFVSLSAILLSSCVAEKRFQDEVSARAKAEEERARLKSENIDLKATEADLMNKMTDYERQLIHLRKDTAVMSTSLDRMTTNYDKLNSTYEQLLDQMGKLREGNADDTKRLTKELQDARKDIQVREDQLHKLELALANREGNLDATRAELDRSKEEVEDKRLQLMARSKRISDLEGVLARKDSAVVALKNNIANALLGFADQGLTVEQKNGKVYVSLEEQLLFKSGSWVVDSKGKEALTKLGKVLQTQPEVGILVEGHTDNVPFGGNGNVADNWDLSAKRATSIVKLLMENSSINPTQLTAAGRSEYLPLDAADTKEARAKNRRTEIIITPKLNELFKILEGN
ncbi:MAG: OmpA family protein [Flavobacteriales bacterium]|nr:OmpA family protein [Flavobacteriales bacterium]